MTELIGKRYRIYLWVMRVCLALPLGTWLYLVFKTNPVQQFGPAAGILFTVVLSAILVGILSEIHKSLERKIEYKGIIMKVVGIDWGQIDDWKWGEFAIPKMQETLNVLATRLIDLDKKEKEALKGNDSRYVVSLHKQFEKKKIEWRKVCNAFASRDVKSLKTSWSDYRAFLNL